MATLAIVKPPARRSSRRQGRRPPSIDARLIARGPGLVVQAWSSQRRPTSSGGASARRRSPRSCAGSTCSTSRGRAQRISTRMAELVEQYRRLPARRHRRIRNRSARSALRVNSRRGLRRAYRPRHVERFSSCRTRRPRFAASPARRAGLAVGHPGRQLVRRLRPAQVVALRDVAAELGQAVPDLLRLDALGDDLEPEVAAEVDRRAHDRGVVLVAGHVHDERLVDLDLVDRQPLEVAERRVAGAEVVDREPHAERRQPLEHGRGARGSAMIVLSVISSSSASAGSLSAASRRIDLVRELRRRAGSHREVDRDRELQALVAPGAALRSASCEHPHRERPDQARVLGERDELVGEEQAALGMLPAHQRLDAAHAAVRAGRPSAGSGARARRRRSRGAGRRSA